MDTEHIIGNKPGFDTQISRAEQTLRASELSYRRLFEAAKDGILILDVDTGRITDVNRFLVKLLGFSHSEMIGRTVGELSPFKDVVSNQAMLEQLQKDGYVRYEDLPLETKDGRKIAVEFVSNVYQAGDKKVIQCNIRDITERKRVEESLRASEERYHSLFENMLDGLAHCRMIFEGQQPTDFIYLEVNQAFETLTGLKNVVGKNVTEIIPGIRASNPEIFETYGRVTLTGQPERFEIHLEQLHTWLAISVYSTTKGCFVAVFENITERKQAEEALQASEGRYHTLFECAPDGIVIADPKSYYLDANASICRMLGYTRAELIGKHASDIVVPAEITHIGKALDIIKTSSNYHREWQFRRKEGSVFTAEVIATMMPDGNLLALIRDVTERKQAENLMRQSQERYRSLIDNARDAIFTIAMDGTFTSLNPAVEIISGVVRADWIGKSFTPMVHPDDLPLAMEMFSRVLKGGQSPVHELRGHPGLKRPAIMEMTLTPQKSETGEIIGVLGIGRDITERKKLEEQFRQSQKMEGIGQLAGGVAHDFNNILAVIQMQAELLKISGGLSTEQSEYANEIGNTVQRAAALTRQLLLFSSREVFQPRDLDLSTSITSTAKMLQRILGEDVTQKLNLSVEPMFIHADAGMMDQVLLNLTVNARDAMPDGGHLIIETSGVEFDEFAASHSAKARAGSFVCLRVSDTGKGIPPEIVSRIFEPFFTTKAVGKGTGLGLATVFGIVQQHQGWINVYSEVGHGTTFRIYLPRLFRNVNVKSARPALTAMRGGNETILLAEDDPSLRVSVRKALSQLGYRILEAPTGVKALEVWKENRDEIRLLLTDLVMPDGMTGKQLAQQLLEKNPKLKVIYMSGYSAEVVGKDFPLQEGVNFLTKPFQAQKLGETIRNCLDRD